MVPWNLQGLCSTCGRQWHWKCCLIVAQYSTRCYEIIINIYRLLANIKNDYLRKYFVLPRASWQDSKLLDITPLVVKRIPVFSESVMVPIHMWQLRCASIDIFSLFSTVRTFYLRSTWLHSLVYRKNSDLLFNNSNVKWHQLFLHSINISYYRKFQRMMLRLSTY